MFATVNRIKYPLIEIRFTGERETPDNFHDYLQALEENYSTREPISLVFDAREAFPLNPKYQLKQAKWMSKNQDLIQSFCVGVAYVIPNTILRQTLQFIFKIQPSPTKFKVFKGIEEARDWAREQLAQNE